MWRLKNILRKWLILITLFLIILTSCSSLVNTMPNEPYVGPYPAAFNDFAQKNPLLAQELGKLPEIKDGISDNEAAALERIIKLYNDSTENFNIAFEQMYRVGNPDVRKYCTPLQSLFWLSEDAKVEELAQIINNYSLEKLLQEAWIFDWTEREQYEGKVLELSESQIKMIVDELITKDPDEKRWFQGFDNNTINEVILIRFKENLSPFSKKAKKTIKNSLVDIEDQYSTYFRWKDFDTVIERLNSPELINYYERKRLRYAEWRTIPNYRYNKRDIYACARYVFNKNRGDCSYTTGFTIYCLRKAGYKAFEIRVRPSSPRYQSHAVCVFYWDGEKYVMDNGRYNPRGIILYDRFISNNPLI
ncbi:MAG: hypothetical protein JSV31_11875 [Desulfobacterales bacterium]|nr:MAG: hypothetical protein JSV31_11875 [Desulfobacterales bacterium]